MPPENRAGGPKIPVPGSSGIPYEKCEILSVTRDLMEERLVESILFLIRSSDDSDVQNLRTTDLTLGSILQYICASNHHNVHLKLVQYYISIISQ